MIEFYARVSNSELKPLLEILRDSNVQIVTIHPEEDEVHLSLSGDWDGYEKLLNSGLTQSLEHFYDDN